MEKIKKLKNKFKEFNLDGYLIPKNDEFFNEYVPLHQDDLQYITNFQIIWFSINLKKEIFYLWMEGTRCKQRFKVEKILKFCHIRF